MRTFRIPGNGPKSWGNPTRRARGGQVGGSGRRLTNFAHRTVVPQGRPVANIANTFTRNSRQVRNMMKR